MKAKIGMELSYTGICQYPQERSSIVIEIL